MECGLVIIDGTKMYLDHDGTNDGSYDNNTCMECGYW